MRLDWKVSEKGDSDAENINSDINIFSTADVRFAISPVGDTTGSDYVYIMLGDSVRTGLLRNKSVVELARKKPRAHETETWIIGSSTYIFYGTLISKASLIALSPIPRKPTPPPRPHYLFRLWFCLLRQAGK